MEGLMQKEIQLRVFFLEEKIELIQKFKREKAQLMNRLDDDIQSMNTQIAELQDEMLQLVKGGGA